VDCPEGTARERTLRLDGSMGRALSGGPRVELSCNVVFRLI
jgi:hypothetical protein